MMDNFQRLADEASAFDRQIRERVKNGHIPDLRRAVDCEYFYNNSWRDPFYVKIDFGEQFTIIDDAIQAYSQKQKDLIKILEVGCGPGHFSLELARQGYNVTGLDLSEECIRVAKLFSENDPWKESRGSLEYLNVDFLSDKALGSKKFDIVIFIGALHHFPDQQSVMSRVNSILNSDGLIIAHEPTRDRVTTGNAGFVYLVKTLLSLADGYFENTPVPESDKEWNSQVENIISKLKYEDKELGKTQSINDNEAGYKEMLSALSSQFNILKCEDRYAFFHEIIGGLRFEREKNHVIANFLKNIDTFLCNEHVLQPTEFFFVGRKL